MPQMLLALDKSVCQMSECTVNVVVLIITRMSLRPRESERLNFDPKSPGRIAAASALEKLDFTA